MTVQDDKYLDIFERISPEELISFTENYKPAFNLLEQFFPTRYTTAEVIKISDFDIDYNPTALAVAENTIAPLAQRPDYDYGYQDLTTFKLETRLTDSQIRKLMNSYTSEEKQQAMTVIFNDAARLKTGHIIARERWRAQALFTGAVKLEENGFKGNLDYQLPRDHKVSIDLANDDVIDALHQWTKLNKDSSKKLLTRWVLQDDDMFKLQKNKTLRSAWLGKTEAETRSYLTEDEVRRAIQGYAGINILTIKDPVNGNYHYTETDYDMESKEPTGAKDVNFIPDKTSVLLPSTGLGYTVVGETAEGMEIGKVAGTSMEKSDGITIFSNYTARPLNYIMTSVQRFTVIYPRCPATMIVTDTGE